MVYSDALKSVTKHVNTLTVAIDSSASMLLPCFGFLRVFMLLMGHKMLDSTRCRVIINRTIPYI